MRAAAGSIGGVVIALLLGACSNAPTRDDVVTELKERGLSEERASCIADGLIAQFGVERIVSTDSLTPQEEELASQVGERCTGGDGVVGTSVAGP